MARKHDIPKKRNKKEKAPVPVLEGVVKMSRDGAGFIAVEGLDDEIYVKATRMRGALHGDRVAVKLSSRGGYGRRREGEVVGIIERTAKPFVGVLHIVGAQAWVLMQSKTMPYDISVEILDPYGTPLFHGVHVPGKGDLRQLGDGEYAVVDVFETVDGKPSELRARPGMKVAAVVDGWSRGEAVPYGHLVDVLGEDGANDTEMHAILAEYGLPYRFEPEVELAADKISDKITDKDLQGRRDFRDTLTFTIDPADAKDFDDALSLRRLEDGNFEVGVHIADVSYYVKPGSAVDKEAQDRGTSVYLVDRTVPMLPEKLSNKLCSLRPNEDKLTFSAVMTLTPAGKVFERWFGRTVIRSDYRFAYETAQQIIDAGDEALEQELRGGTDGLDGHPESFGIQEGTLIPRDIKDAVLTLWKLAKILRDKRFAAGAIGFDRPEMKVDVDEKGKPIAVHQKISREANWLIEEFMLLANRSVAEFVATDGKFDGKARKDARTFVYRVHDLPNTEKLFGLSQFAGNFGYKASFGEGKDVAKELDRLLGAAKDKPEYNAFQMIALRAMAKAKYSTDNIGHYGLAFRFYTHFTSPIRRYPDLMVHRLLAMYLGGASSQDRDRYEAQCVHASERETVAAAAERDSIKYKLVEYMQDKIGNEYDGTISGLTDWGMYVETDEDHIEGMVALREVRSDFFEFIEDRYEIRGRRSGRVFRLGDKVRIRVKATNLDQRLLDYELEEEGSGPAGRREGSGPAGYGQSGYGPARGGNKLSRKAKVKAAIAASKKSSRKKKSR